MSLNFFTESSAVDLSSGYRWATVQSLSPIVIRFDGDTANLSITPDSLVPESGLIPTARVWCQLYGRRVIILGTSYDNSPPSRGPQISLVPYLASGVSQYYLGVEPSYFINSDGNTVLSGTLQRTGNWPTSFTDVLQLPPGTYPHLGNSANRQFFTVPASDESRFGRIKVGDDGLIEVELSSTAGSFSFDGVTINMQARLDLGSA